MYLTFNFKLKFARKRNQWESTIYIKGCNEEIQLQKFRKRVERNLVMIHHRDTECVKKDYVKKNELGKLTLGTIMKNLKKCTVSLVEPRATFDFLSLHFLLTMFSTWKCHRKSNSIFSSSLCAVWMKLLEWTAHIFLHQTTNGFTDSHSNSNMRRAGCACSRANGCEYHTQQNWLQTKENCPPIGGQFG